MLGKPHPITVLGLVSSISLIFESPLEPDTIKAMADEIVYQSNGAKDTLMTIKDCKNVSKGHGS
jgi:hypothetical protein